MPIHLLKVCVGIDSIEHLARVQKKRRAGGKNAVFHYTRHMPKRADELIESGSLYWIIKGFVRVRQKIVGFQTVHFEDEGRHCGIKLERKLVPVAPLPRKPHQGWRYFDPADAPADLTGKNAKKGALPPELLAELHELGLL